VCEYIYRIEAPIYEACGDIRKSPSVVVVLVHGYHDPMDGLRATSENFSRPGKH